MPTLWRGDGDRKAAPISTGRRVEGAYQDDWQSDEYISAIDGMANDDDGRLEEA